MTLEGEFCKFMHFRKQKSLSEGFILFTFFYLNQVKKNTAATEVN